MYRWVTEPALDAGASAEAGLGQAFPTQADAEAWFAQEWQTLADAGVTDVTLMREEAEVYGPMGLDPA